MSKNSNPPEWRIDDPRRLGEYEAVVDPTEAAEIKRLEVNNAPIDERSHEHVAEAPRDLSGMTVNERLHVARLTDAYDAAVASGDLKRINAVLARVGLWQDENGMNWSVANDA